MLLFNCNMATTNPDAIFNEILVRELTRYIIVILPAFCYIINIQNYQNQSVHDNSWIHYSFNAVVGIVECFLCFLTLIGYANSSESFQSIWYLFPPIFTIIAYTSDYEKVKLKLKGLGPSYIRQPFILFAQRRLQSWL